MEPTICVPISLIQNMAKSLEECADELHLHRCFSENKEIRREATWRAENASEILKKYSSWEEANKFELLKYAYGRR